MKLQQYNTFRSDYHYLPSVANSFWGFTVQNQVPNPKFAVSLAAVFRQRNTHPIPRGANGVDVNDV
jgi:hypothetical protein